jgi:transposase InsO family protein/transposase-like protein
MRLSAAEKEEIIRMVEGSELGVNKTLRELGIHKSTFYIWYKLYHDHGIDGLQPRKISNRQQWNSIPQSEKNLVIEIALEYPSLSPRELSCKLSDTKGLFISESSVYRILKAKGLITSPAHILLAAADEFSHKPGFVHEMWQTDFTYFKILGWGWYYLSTVMDDYSRYIIHWELCKTMNAEDVKRTIDKTMEKAQLGKYQRPKLLSDNGSCYIADELKQYLKNKKIKQVHGRPHHPQTQGKIERYHRSMKNVVKLDNYYYPEELEESLANFVHFYNHQRYHESLDNVTPADVYHGRKDEILKYRERIKKLTMKRRRKNYQQLKIASLI